MATIDERIVAIAFENSNFEAKVSSTMATLSKLNAAISRTGAGNPLAELESSASRVNFAGLTRAIDGIGSHFSGLTSVASVALGNLTAMAAVKGAQLASSLFDPIKQGFQDYETQINAVQTILANTGLQGASGLKQVSAVLQDLQKYANQTVFNFADMAKNIGTFTAAGVDLKTAQESIKGIANLAALSGSSAEQASGAMYQLSQAIAAGRVNLQDWNSVVNAGIGGSVFQKALVNAAVAMGTLKDNQVKLIGPMKQLTINGESFRQSISAGPGKNSWLTSGVLTSALKNFTGDMTDAQLKAEGFSASQIKLIQQQAKTAVNAATQIKTFSQLAQALKEEVATAWGNVFRVLFGNIDQAKTLFSSLHTTMENALTGPINAFAKTLQEWAKLGGRSTLLQGLKQAFTDLKDVIDPIKNAFREIFPPETAKGLLTLTQNFKALMERLQPSRKTIEEIQRVFAGLFSILHIGWELIKVGIGLFGNLVSATKPAAGGILELAARFGDWLTRLDETVNKEGVIKALFGGLADYVQKPLDVIKQLANAIASLFKGDISGAAGKFQGAVSGVSKALGPLGGLLRIAQGAWEGFIKILDKIKTLVSPLMDDVAHVIGHFGDTLAADLRKADFSDVFSAVQTGLIGGIFLAIKKALGGGINIDFGGGVLKNISNTFKGLTGNLEQMQKVLQAATLLEIAGAIGILAAAVALLSTIDPKKLTNAMTGVAVGMGELVGAVAILNKAVSGGSFLRMPFIAGSLILLSSALVILSGAMKIFATMSWDELAKGLAGVGGALIALGLGVKTIDGPSVIATGLALIPLSIGLNILAAAVKIFATMSWEEMAKGIVSVAGSLTAVGLAVNLMPPTLPLIGAGLILVAGAMVILSGAILAFGHMAIATLAKGIGAVAASLVLIGLAMNTFPPTTPLIAAGLVLVAGALTVLAGAISLMGHMSIETLAKGLITMGAALGILAVGLTAMSGTLVGSAALVAAATAFAILGPAMALIGNLPLGVILKALAGIAGAMLVLAIGGALAAAPLTALGVALLAIGAGLAAIGGAVFLFAKGISLLSGVSTKAMAAVIASVTALIAVFPSMVINFIKGLVQILEEIVKLAPQIVAGLVVIASDLLDGIVKLAPKIAEAIGVLVTQIIKVLEDNFGPILDAGFQMLEQLLKGIANNLPQVIPLVVRVITTFLNGIADNAEKLVTAGMNVLTHFLNGIAHNIWRVLGAAGNIIANLVTGIGNVLWKVLNAGGDVIAHLITGIGNNLVKLIAAGGTAIANFITGVGNAAKKIITAGTNAARTFINALVNGIVSLVDTVYRGIIRLMNALAAEIRKNNKPFWEAGWNIAWAIVQGIVDGLGNLAGHIVSKVESIAKSIPHKFLQILGISSPSRVMMEIGSNTMLGLAKGIENLAPNVNQSMTAAANATVQSAKVAFSKMPNVLGGVADIQPKITPVLDLSQVKRDAPTLANLIPSPVVTAKVSSDQAAKISDQQTVAATEAATTTTPTTAVTFNQNNYSPDPLPAIEIYRQTKNQLAQVKSLVGA